jgi:hypothetical protein
VVVGLNVRADETSLDVRLDLQTASSHLVVVLPAASFDVRFDFHTLSFSLWLLKLNIARRRHVLGIEASNLPHLYMRRRDGESITRRKIFLRTAWRISAWQVKGRQCPPCPRCRGGRLHIPLKKFLYGGGKKKLVANSAPCLWGKAGEVCADKT